MQLVLLAAGGLHGAGTPRWDAGIAEPTAGVWRQRQQAVCTRCRGRWQRRIHHASSRRRQQPGVADAEHTSIACRPCASLPASVTPETATLAGPAQCLPVTVGLVGGDSQD